MDESGTDKASSGRPALIEAVQTPLGFFSLVVLVVEVIFGIVAGISEGNSRTWIIVSMIALIFLLVIFVAVLAFFRPEALRGERASISERKLSNSSNDQTYTEIVDQKMKVLEAELQTTRDQLRDYEDLKNSVVAVLAFRDDITIDDICRIIKSQGGVEDPDRAAILRVIGVLVNEGRVTKGRYMSGSYHFVK